MWTADALPKDHSWTAREGFKILIANRGAIRMDIPREWVVTPREGGILLASDRDPPDDSCRIEMSVLSLPVVSPLPIRLADMLTIVQSAEAEDLRPAGRIHVERRGTTEVGWFASHENEVDGDREILTRHLFACAPGAQAVVTYRVYVDAADRFARVWRELLRSLRLGERLDLSGRAADRN